MFQRKHQSLLSSTNQSHLSQSSPTNPRNQTKLKLNQKHNQLKPKRLRNDLKIIGIKRTLPPILTSKATQHKLQLNYRPPDTKSIN